MVNCCLQAYYCHISPVKGERRVYSFHFPMKKPGLEKDLLACAVLCSWSAMEPGLEPRSLTLGRWRGRGAFYFWKNRAG